MKAKFGWVAAIVVLVIFMVVALLMLQSRKSNAQPVAYVDGVAIDVREFALFLRLEAAQVSDYFKRTYNVDDSPTFWTDEVGGEIPIERARMAAIKKLKRIKVEQRLAEQYGLIDEWRYDAFLNRLKEENRRRAEAAAANQVIYGPIRYDEAGYYSYLFSNMAIELKRVMADKEWPITEQELLAQYEKLKDRHYKRRDGNGYVPFEEVKDHVKETMIEERYEEVVSRLIDAAEVRIVESVYSRTRIR